MRISKVVMALLGLLASTITHGAEPKPAPSRMLLDDFESDPAGWTYIGGQEFPGAKGSLALDADMAHAGKRSYLLKADLTAGAYVGTWRDLASLKGRDFKELHLWIKAVHVSKLGVRITDSSDQCHQRSGIPLRPTEAWQEVVLKIADLAGGEHWGGANDGKWHGPAKGFGLNIGKDSFGKGIAPEGSIHIDDVEIVLGPAVDGHPTVLAGVLSAPACRPGFSTRLTYRWKAEPMGRDFEASVHFIGSDGKMAFQADHTPDVATSIWSGRVEYTRTILVSTDVPAGEYRIMLGLYDRKAAERGWDHPALKAGPGVTAEPDLSYQIGVLKVDAQAPLPKLPAPTLKLDDYAMTFHDEFDELSVSAAGPGTRWYTKTKENFGDAHFTALKDGFPFSVEKGVLRIEAAKKDGKWCAGILASADPQGQGFSQKFGYFEMRAKFPSSLGMWPAFWLLGQPSLTDKKQTNIEIDVVEHYAVMPNAVFSTMHLWPPEGKHWAQGDCITAPGLTTDFHNYGVSVDEAQITWYFDGIEIQQQKTPEEAKVPLYLLVNLAMGGGWPIDKAVSPSYMYVDFVRAYAKRH